MPYSADENNDFVLDTVKIINPSWILDVGAGAGKYGKLLAHPSRTIRAVEIWEPYINRFGLTSVYDEVYQEDVRDRTDFKYDLVIFGDVLEHMSKKDALTVWSRVKSQATWGMISLPIVHYPQGESEGNPYEEHVQDHVDPDDLRRSFGPFDFEESYNVTGTFFRRFK